MKLAGVNWGTPCLCLAMMSWLGCAEQREVAPGSGTSVTVEDVGEEFSEAIESASDLARQEKDKLERELAQHVDAAEARIEELKQKADSVADEAKEELERKLDTLRQKRDAAAESLEEIRAETSAAWHDLKTGAKAAAEELKKAYDDAADELDDSAAEKAQ